MRTFEDFKQGQGLHLPVELGCKGVGMTLLGEGPTARSHGQHNSFENNGSHRTIFISISRSGLFLEKQGASCNS